MGDNPKPNPIPISIVFREKLNHRENAPDLQRHLARWTLRTDADSHTTIRLLYSTKLRYTKKKFYIKPVSVSQKNNDRFIQNTRVSLNFKVCLTALFLKHVFASAATYQGLFASLE